MDTGSELLVSSAGATSRTAVNRRGNDKLRRKPSNTGILSSAGNRTRLPSALPSRSNHRTTTAGSTILRSAGSNACPSSSRGTRIGRAVETLVVII
jgi:hypothetical protein